MKNEEDKIIEKLFDTVRRKKEEIEKIKRPNYKTNMQFNYNEDNVRDTININTVSSIKVLIEITSFLHLRKESHNRSCEILGVEKTKFSWCGFTYDQWVADLKHRAAIINVNSKHKDLNDLEAQLDLLVSPEMRRKLEIEAIQRQLED